MEDNKPLILITNDDGIFAKGLKELVRAVKDLGEVWIVAPDRAQSGKVTELRLICRFGIVRQNLKKTSALSNAQARQQTALKSHFSKFLTVNPI